MIPHESVATGEPLSTAAGHRRAVRNEVVWQLLHSTLARQVAVTSRDQLDVVDAGGGTGIFAVPIAALGHRVTVVDPSPDSLAGLKRRAAEAGVTVRVHAVQGDVDHLKDSVGAEVADLVLCHSVLEVVDDPTVALREIAAVLRPAAALSLLVANRNAVVLSKVMAGHVAEALALLRSSHHPDAEREALPRRFTATDLRRAVEEVGLVVVAEHGVRVFTDLVPASVADEPGATETLVELEVEASEHPTFRSLATQIHVLARRP